MKIHSGTLSMQDNLRAKRNGSTRPNRGILDMKYRDGNTTNDSSDDDDDDAKKPFHRCHQRRQLEDANKRPTRKSARVAFANDKVTKEEEKLSLRFQSLRLDDEEHLQCDANSGTDQKEIEDEMNQPKVDTKKPVNIHVNEHKKKPRKKRTSKKENQGKNPTDKNKLSKLEEEKNSFGRVASYVIDAKTGKKITVYRSARRSVKADHCQTGKEPPVQEMLRLAKEKTGDETRDEKPNVRRSKRLSLKYTNHR